MDNSDLNTVRRPTTAVNIPNTAKLVSRLEEEPRPVIAGEESPPGSGSYGLFTLSGVFKFEIRIKKKYSI